MPRTSFSYALTITQNKNCDVIMANFQSSCHQTSLQSLHRIFSSAPLLFHRRIGLVLVWSRGRNRVATAGFRASFAFRFLLLKQAIFKNLAREITSRPFLSSYPIYMIVFCGLWPLGPLKLLSHGLLWAFPGSQKWVGQKFAGFCRLWALSCSLAGVGR